MPGQYRIATGIEQEVVGFLEQRPGGHTFPTGEIARLAEVLVEQARFVGIERAAICVPSQYQ